MKKILFIALMFTLLAPGLASAFDSAAPLFSLKGLDGASFTLSDSRGKEAVLLFFWTTWCPFCRKEIAGLTARKEELVKAGMKVITVNVNESAARVKNFVESHSLAIPVLLDTGGSVAKDYSIVGVPTFILIDKKGNIVFDSNSFPDDYKALLKVK